MVYASFADFLHSKYQERKQRNPKYSLRSFARDVGVSSGRLTNLLKGRDIPGEETIEKFSTIFELIQEDKDVLKKVIYSQKYLRRGTGFSKQLNEHEFGRISDWKTWCIYTMFQATDYEPSVEWFCKKLNLMREDVELCLQKLNDLGVIAPNEVFYEVICESVTTTNDVPSSSIRKFHKEFIPIGMDAMDMVDVQERDVSSLTFCIDKKKLPEYKKLISDFRAKLSNLAKQEETSDELYQLNIQFFPMSFKGKVQ